MFTIIGASQVPQDMRQFVHSELVRRQVNNKGFDGLSVKELEFRRFEYDHSNNQQGSLVTTGWFICPWSSRVEEDTDPEWLIEPCKRAVHSEPAFQLVPQLTICPIYVKRCRKLVLHGEVEHKAWTI